MRRTGARAAAAPAAEVWVVDAAGAEAFAGRVVEASRILPLVLVSTSRRHDERPLVDPTRLAEETAGLADVAVMTDDAASWALSDRLGRFSAWGGAVRIFLPDATEADPWERHPLVRVDAHRPAAALAQVAARVRAAAGLPATAPAPLTVLPAPSTAPQAPGPAPGRDQTQREAELTRLTSQLADRDRLLREKDDTIAELRRQVQKMAKQLRAGREAGQPEPTAVYADPERQFRHEVEQRWLTAVPETEREERPLAAYRLGRDWLASLEAIELVDRSKILDVVVEVLTGRIVDNTARRVRRMRAGDGGGSGPRVRDDGAVAWRCDIKQRAASAPRLMWWRLPGNAIELGRVAAHDDIQLR
ncbi:hypothetical protein WDH52_22910 [Streptomyces sp. TRM70308]|uniref:TMF family protein n=1 Tax=Streptomyces sp. TRM70308 TaxID=3131932 RepID=UPI003D0461FB